MHSSEQRKKPLSIPSHPDIRHCTYDHKFFDCERGWMHLGAPGGQIQHKQNIDMPSCTKQPNIPGTSIELDASPLQLWRV